jgi:hypothetical protein
MASRMKIWIALVLGGIVWIGMWGIPPKSYEDWRGSRWGANRFLFPERDAYNRVLSEVYRKNWVYQRLQWGDSVATLARISEETGRRWWVALPDSAPGRFLPGLETAITAQLSAEGISEPRVPVGVVLMDFRTGTHPGVSRGYSRYNDGLEIHVGREPETPFCFLVDPVYGTGSNPWARMVWAPADSSAPPNPLGPCALHARYGTPGPAVFRWLAEGAYVMGIGGPGIVRSSQSPEVGPWATLSLGQRALWYEGSPEAEACLAGRVEGCRKALFDGSFFPRWWGAWEEDAVLDAHGTITRLPEYGFSLPFGGREFGLLRDLEEEFGQERFQAFWSSDLGVEEAFRSAFGVGAPEWAMAWGQARFGTSKVGATVPLEAAALSILTIGILAGVALVLGRRRG